MRVVEADAIADWVYRETGSEPSVPPGPAVLLERLIGARRVRFLDGSPVTVDFGHGGPWVTLPRGLSAAGLSVAIARSLAEIASRSTGHAGAGREDLMAIAAAILMPAAALSLVVGALHFDAGDVARAFAVPTELAARRLRRCGWIERSGEYAMATLVSAR